MDVEDVGPDGASKAPASETAAVAQADDEKEQAALSSDAPVDDADLPVDDDDADEPDDDDHSPQPASRAGSVVRYAALGILLVVAAGAIVVAILLPTLNPERHAGPPNVAATAPKRTEPSSSAEVPSPTAPDAAPFNARLDAVAQHESEFPGASDADAVYLTALQRSGMTITNTGQAISGGHAVCAYLAQGQTPAAAALMVMAGGPGLKLADANNYVSAAISAYCPQ